MRKLTIVAIAMLALACYNRHGNRSQSISSASLETVYLRNESLPSICYSLRTSDPPGERGGWSGEGKLRLRFI
jgi:hypothetical protein